MHDLAQNWSMQVPLIQVDAFTQELFSGNPAAICPLLEWPKDSETSLGQFASDL